MAGSVAGPPTAAFVAVTPSPRSTAVNYVTLNFNEDVTGVDGADFVFKHNGNVVTLPASQVTAVSAMSYRINVGSYSGEGGTYELALVATGSGIRDTDNNLLASGATTTWTVDNSVNVFTDSRDTFLGDGVAQDFNGNRSLRAAVMEANASVGQDVITLSAGTYLLTLDGRFEDEARSGDLDITSGITIRGVSPRDTIIDAGTLDRLFHVFSTGVLTLENLTLQHGEAFDGAAIFNEGIVNLKNVNIIDNKAYNQGGGIYNLGTLTGNGVSISRNTAGSRGGGINNQGTATLVSTTISTNSAVSRGGGIFTEGVGSTYLINATVAANHAASRAGGAGTDTTGQLRVANTIIGTNTTEALVPLTGVPRNLDLLGRVTSDGHNIIGVLDSNQISGTAAGLLTSDVFGRQATPVNPGLSPLTDHVVGKPDNGLWHHPLAGGSIALDAGDNAIYPFTPVKDYTDGAGTARLIEGNLDGIVTIDVGASEFYLNQPVAIFTATPNPAGINETITLDGSGSTHTNVATGSILLWEWDLDNDGFFDDAVGPIVTTSFGALGNYTVRLRVTDNSSPAQTNVMTSVLTVDVPLKPTILRPFTITTDLTPTFRWQNGSGTFRLVVDNLSTGQNGVLVVNNLTGYEYTPTSKLFPGNYRVTVTATNGAGSTASDPLLFTTTRVNLVSPTGFEYDKTPEFTWDAVAGTTRYDVYVNRMQPSFIDQVYRNQFVTGTSVEPGFSLGPGKFSWWVRAYDADGNVGDWSLSKQFTIGAPQLLTPGPVTLNQTPTFTWTDVGAPRYDLWVDWIGHKAGYIYAQSLTTTSFTPTAPEAPLPNGLYRAWVRAVGPTGETGLWSNVLNFSMDFRVGPVVYTPVGQITDRTPEFSWQAAEFVTHYDLWVDNLSTGTSQYIRVNVPNVVGATKITYTHPTPLPPGNFRWWVRSVSEDGFKSNWTVATDFNLPAPAILAPRGAISNTSTPTFIWKGIPEWVRYELWVDNVTTGTSRVLNISDITTTSYTPTLPFGNGTFRVWVRGFDAVGNDSPWSGVANFSIGAGVSTGPSLQSPSGVTGSRPTFNWTAVSNAVSYELLVKDLTANGQPEVIRVTNITTTSYLAPITLTSGHTYRWWVRGISSGNVAGAWSFPLDFRVVSAQPADHSSPASPADFGRDVVIPVTAPIDVGYSFEDDVVAISAHPARVTVHVAERVLDAVPDVPDPDAAAMTGAEVDSLMEELAEGAWILEEFTAISDVELPAATVDVVSEGTAQEAQDGDQASTAALPAVAGILAAGTVMKRRDERKRRQ
ncbi:MAG: PKD domain-containing protein [Planctomycetaceae bacterium]|nr:PKD domain-containing protein [Planctomycetaceae bacterium]